jgi:ATP-dependent helicase/nuclease subunit A
LAVTESPAHAALFAEGSRAEVPLIGSVKTPRGTFTVSGQVDRLAVTDSEVLIVDYKTNRPPPDQAAAWRSPIAASSRSIARLLGRDLSRPPCGLSCCGRRPRLMEIDAETLDASMPYTGHLDSPGLAS